MKFLGLVICLGTTIGAAVTVGFHLYLTFSACCLFLEGQLGSAL